MCLSITDIYIAHNTQCVAVIGLERGESSRGQWLHTCSMADSYSRSSAEQKLNFDYLGHVMDFTSVLVQTKLIKDSLFECLIKEITLNY